jgi:ATP-binding cassette subfamily B protein
MTAMSLLGDRLSGLLSCVVLATFRWWLGLMLFVVWMAVRRPARAFVVSRVNTFRRATAKLRMAVYLLNLAAGERAAKEVRVFGLDGWLLERHREEWLEAMRPSWEELGQIERRIARVGLLVLAAYVVAAGVLGHAAWTGEAGLRTLATMLPMLPMSMSLGSITITDVRLAAMLANLPDVESLASDLAPHAALADAGEPARGLPARELRFEGVRFRYPEASTDVLKGLDLTLPAGSSLAVVGVNGAGKTTLVTLLARLRDPTGGRITVDGTDLARLRAREWQRQVAVVFQDFTPFPLTARENVALNLLGEPVDANALARAAEKADALGLVEELPFGWETVLSPRYARGADLSGGQWQRIALARALYAVERGARVLVLDEPTAQLDVRREAAFYDRFLEITGGTTSVVISHRFSTVRRADRIAVLDGGRVSELGSHAELVAAGGTYAQMFELQARRFREDAASANGAGSAPRQRRRG